MKHSRLGRTDVEVTQLGYGGGPLGGLFEPLDDATAAAALAAAWDAGIRYYDTSPHYGIGHSERRTGEHLHDKPRDSFTLSTKVGRLLVEQDPQGRMDESFQVPATHRRVWDFSRDGILRSVEDSLVRMGTDRIDVLFLHDAEGRFDEAVRTGYPALAELRDQGVVGAVGAGMYDNTMLTRLVTEADPDVVMLSGRYTLLDHRALDDLLPACVERGVSVLAASVFNSGLLATDRPAPGARYDYAPAGQELLDRAERLADVCAAHGVTLPQAAMAFPLQHPAVAGVVVGMRTADEVRRNAAAFAAPVPPALWDDLRAAGLLDERTAA
ncbi:aldo/keto reductase [Streptomyces sp. A7024]|uniref:Aldo/keto reductase n=1 Tax=Streptomyces coryli TaxID=1128680 RepID=A0A6G4U407_9ACTN|nr:aldo/keto reductase [Streptomyces coryli]NGN66742.1 aldo/keto reductase [Streptomyces coryli]